MNGAAGTAYDTHFHGSIAAFRIYNEAFEESKVNQNFVAVADGTDVDGDSITIDAILDASDTAQGIGNTATLTSGATVRLDSATGAFTYDTNGAFDDLLQGESAVDTFTYRVTDGNGATGTASVLVTVFGTNEANDVTISATESVVTNFCREPAHWKRSAWSGDVTRAVH